MVRFDLHENFVGVFMPSTLLKISDTLPDRRQAAAACGDEPKRCSESQYPKATTKREKVL